MILTGMTVERCINVTYPLSLSRADAALSRSRIISVAAWLLAALCSIPQVRRVQITFNCFRQVPPDTQGYPETKSMHFSVVQAIIFHVERAPTCTDFHQVGILFFLPRTKSQHIHCDKAFVE